MAMLKVGTSASSLSGVPLDPSAMTWGLQDISASDAGRTQDGTMQKMLVTQKRKIQLTWTLPDAAQASAILSAFNHEYFYVQYFDPMDNALETRQFYKGDMSAPFQWYSLPGKGTRYTTLSFDIIER